MTFFGRNAVLHRNANAVRLQTAGGDVRLLRRLAPAAIQLQHAFACDVVREQIHVNDVTPDRFGQRRLTPGVDFVTHDVPSRHFASACSYSCIVSRM